MNEVNRHSDTGNIEHYILLFSSYHRRVKQTRKRIKQKRERRTEKKRQKTEEKKIISGCKSPTQQHHTQNQLNEFEPKRMHKKRIIMNRMEEEEEEF